MSGVICDIYEYQLTRVARWPSGLERWTGDRVVMGSNPAAAASFRNFGNFDGGDNKISRTLLYGVCARGSKISHQSALEMC